MMPLHELTAKQPALCYSTPCPAPRSGLPAAALIGRPRRIVVMDGLEFCLSQPHQPSSLGAFLAGKPDVSGLLVPEGQMASFGLLARTPHVPEPDEGARFIAFRARSALLAETIGLGTERLEPLLIEARHRRFPLDARLKEIAGELFSPPVKGATGEIYLKGKCLDLLVRLFGLIEGQKPALEGLTPREQTGLEAACQLIAGRLSSPPDLAELAGVSGLSQRRLMQGFRQLFGKTIAVYQRDLRLEEARRLLEETDLPLKQIAHRVGYGHANNFIAAYRDCFGAPPRRHSRQCAA